MTGVGQLRGVVVVEIAGSVAGAYCSKMFADGGAEVTVVGAGGLNAHEQTYLHRQVRRVETLDVVDLAAADVLIESASSNPLRPMKMGHEQLVHVRISPLGHTGERAHWRSSDLIDYAMSGHGFLNGDPGKEPVGGAPNQPAVAAGLHAFIGAMAAMLARPRLGRGQAVDIAHLDVMVSLHRVTLLQQLMTGLSPLRTGRRRSLGAANGLYECDDGWVSIVAATPAQAEALRAVTGIQDEGPELDSSLERWCREQRAQDVVELLQLVRVPAAPVLTSSQVLQDPQLRDRRFFEQLNLPAGPTLVPGPPMSFQHVQPLARDGNIAVNPPHRGLTPMWAQAGARWEPGGIDGGPLAGLKVLDLTRVWAGPLSARMLRDLGADVISVEAPNQRGPRVVPESYVRSTGYFPNNDPGDQPWNRNVFIAKFGMGKRSIALDLQTEAGRAVLTRLIAQSHVLIENFSTRVMPQLGFDEGRLHELNPNLIYLSISAYGRSGPAADWVGYGSTIDSHAGLTRLAGYQETDPLRGGVAWPDPIAALHGTAAVLSRLWNGQTTSAGGATIELSQLESMIAAVGDQFVAAQLDGERTLAGNRSAGLLAQGVYRCRGDDEWIAVSIPDDAALQALFTVMNRPDLLGEQAPEKFDHDLFDRTLGAIARDHDANELATVLQRVGVPAAKVASAADVLNDPHLRSRGTWVTIDQPHIGEFVVPRFPIGLSASPAREPAPAPMLGEHNQKILTEAGYNSSQIAALLADEIVATTPPA